MNRSSAPSVFPVLLVNFIGMLGYSLIIPILVFLVQRFGGNAFIYGLLGATYPAFQLFGAPLLGGWSDRIGRRRVLLISQVGTFVAWCIFIVSLLPPARELFGVDSQILGAFSVSLPLLLLFGARALDGLTGNRNQQGELQGYANSMGSFASILGLIGGGTLYAALGPRVFYFAGVIIAINFLLAFRLRGEGRAKTKPSLV